MPAAHVRQLSTEKSTDRVGRMKYTREFAEFRTDNGKSIRRHGAVP